QVRRILAAQGGALPSLRTIQRWLEARELTTRPGGEPPEAFGRFQADTVNEIWTADFMNGPDIGGKPAFLAGINDDRARVPRGSPARHPAASLEELNGLLAAWLRTVYHARPHSETGQAPAARLAAGGEPALPDPALLKEAFSWSVIRQVRKTATVSVEGNVYSVDPFLTGRKVECVFDPFDMTELTVYWQGRKVGRVVPQVIGRHAHPKAPPD